MGLDTDAAGTQANCEPANHLFAVPLFVAGHLLLVAGIFSDGWLFVAALGCVVVSLVLQKYGHSLEQDQPPPFAGPRDFVRRLYAEQFCNFWRFLLSGKWYASLGTRNDV